MYLTQYELYLNKTRRKKLETLGENIKIAV